MLGLGLYPFDQLCSLLLECLYGFVLLFLIVAALEDLGYLPFKIQHAFFHVPLELRSHARRYLNRLGVIRLLEIVYVENVRGSLSLGR